ncbi:MAG: hypothetical protein HOP08_19085 [Cyclobacteriaceae bacterium]|nr:hypothetical protein [Cyclobacteriaceae bacterium]
MKKISFSDILPHVLAIVVFLIVTISFFNPFFFENKTLNQNDITQFIWGSQELRDYRAETGDEGLWAGTMFSGMPAYLVNLDWSDDVVVAIKKTLSLFLPHPICNIFLAFISYYIMLLAFRVRPYLAIAGALVFGLSSYMIIGLSAGHNARIGAIAFMPLVMAGIHLAFTNRRILGLGVTAAGLSLQLRENHLQITYYLMIIVIVYGIIQLVEAIREKKLVEFFKTIGILVGAAAIAVCTFIGPLWAITEFSKYSTRGQSELKTTSTNTYGSGLPKSYAFAYSNGIFEPLTALVPNFYGGSSFSALVNDEKSKTYQALVNSGDQNMANQLAQRSSSYWGDQPLSAPYYEGAIVVFLFVLGCFIVEKKYWIWLVTVSGIAIAMSWGDSFQSFNYFIFDYLPGYNKFRSVTFVMVIVFFSLPLLGMMGLESILQTGVTKEVKRKLIIAFGLTGGVCLLFFVGASAFSYARPNEANLPAWFLNALHSDRESLLRSDAFRSLAFITSIFILLYFDVPKRTFIGFVAFLIIMSTIDVVVVDKRYFTEANYQRKTNMTKFTATAADEAMLQDKSYHRVLNIADFYSAATSQFHNSLGGYNGVRLKRYQELYDSAISVQTEQLIETLQKGAPEFKRFGVLNMLNTKYFVYGPDVSNVIPNPAANGVAWFVKNVEEVNSPNEELIKTQSVNTKEVAVIDVSKFKTNHLLTSDSLASIKLIEKKPFWLKYESQTSQAGLAVFSEIYYPWGWHAKIDNVEAPIMRANYVLRALELPKGTHTIEFVFEPRPYTVGNKITMIFGWILLLVLLGSLGYSLRKQ